MRRASSPSARPGDAATTVQRTAASAVQCRQHSTVYSYVAHDITLKDSAGYAKARRLPATAAETTTTAHAVVLLVRRIDRTARRHNTNKKKSNSNKSKSKRRQHDQRNQSSHLLRTRLDCIPYSRCESNSCIDSTAAAVAQWHPVLSIES